MTGGRRRPGWARGCGWSIGRRQSEASDERRLAAADLDVDKDGKGASMSMVWWDMKDKAIQCD